MTNSTESFDYIVVGGGSAGCVLANRLSSDPANKVLLLEAGNKGHFLSRVPVSFSLLIDNPAANWCYRSEPESGTNDRHIPIPRGKLLGGSSAINGLVYVRGQQLDYDTWAQLGNRGWSYADVLPFFKSMESFDKGGSAYRGRSGPLRVTEVADQNPIYEQLFKAGAALGIVRNDDYNGADQEGFSRTQTTSSRGRRMSADFAYLRPIRHRKNLTIKTRALVTRLLFNQKVCIGVEAVIGGKIVKFEARKEVILSAGAINSPQILELSGVGQPAILEKNDIPLVQAINGVGENLRDHIAPRLVFRITKPGIAYNDSARGMNLLKEILKYGINGSGFLNLPSAPVLGFFKTRTELAGPDIQVHFIPYRVVLENGKRKLGEEPGITCTVNQNQPESVGSVHIKSSNPEQHPAIRYNFLSSRHDIDTLVAGVRLVRSIMNTDEMQMYCGEEMSPGSDCSSDEDILAFIRTKAETVYHPVGTCKMGKDAKSVVDEKLRVHQIKNLRIADASIMPTLISGNTNGPCMMIGEKCADFIMNH